MVSGAVSDLWIPGMFWTQDLKSFTVCFALGIVHITEKSSGSEREEKGFTLYVEVTEGRKKAAIQACWIFLTLLFLWDTWIQKRSDSHTVKTKMNAYYVVQAFLNEGLVGAGDHLGVTSLHVSKCHFRVDRVAAGHAENLQVCVFITLVHLQTHTE